MIRRQLSSAALALAASTAFAAAGNTANTTGNGSGTLLKPIAIAKSSDMAFGNVVWGGAAGGTLQMTAAASTGALTMTPDGTNVSASYGTQSPATFQVGGTKSKSFTVAMAPATLVLAAASNSSNTMTVTALRFVDKNSATAGQATGGTATLNTTAGTVNSVSVSGQDTLYVYGLLNVPATAIEDNYSTGNTGGTGLTVTVTYQ